VPRLRLFYRRRGHAFASEAFREGGSQEEMEASVKAKAEGLGLPPWLVAILVSFAVELLRKWLEQKLSSPPPFDDFAEDDGDEAEGGYQ
jgi:hypothetical protein